MYRLVPVAFQADYFEAVGLAGLEHAVLQTDGGNQRATLVVPTYGTDAVIVYNQVVEVARLHGTHVRQQCHLVIGHPHHFYATAVAGTLLVIRYISLVVVGHLHASGRDVVCMVGRSHVGDMVDDDSLFPVVAAGSMVEAKRAFGGRNARVVLFIYKHLR